MEDKLVQSALFLGKEIDAGHPLHVALNAVNNNASNYIQRIQTTPHDKARMDASAIYRIVDRQLQSIDPFPLSYLEMIPIARQLDTIFPRYTNKDYTQINYMGTSDFSHRIAERVLMCYATRQQEFTNHDVAKFYQTLVLGRDAKPESLEALKQDGGMDNLILEICKFLESQIQMVTHIGTKV